MLPAPVTVDGITSRPSYDYAPPEFFFAAPGTGNLDDVPAVFLASDYGAVADPTVDNRAALQAAIDAAHTAGGGMVLLEAGTYGVAGKPSSVGSVHLKDNVFLKGTGMGETTLRVVDGWDGKLTGIVRTPWGEPNKNYGIADLTLDGNRENTSGKVDGYFSGGMPGGTVTDEDATLLRVESQHNSGYGFDPHERTERLEIRSCVSHHNGLDGFVADFIIDGQYIDNLAYENDRHGFNICTTTQDFLLLDNIAINNGSTGYAIQRGSEDIPSPHNIVIKGGLVRGNARDGILVQMSDNVEVTGVQILENGTYGVRIYGSSQVHVHDNEIRDNSRADDGRYAGVQIREDDDWDIANKIFRANNNAIYNNDISWQDGLSGSYGIQERDGLVSSSTIANNGISGEVRDVYRSNVIDSTFHHNGDSGANAFDGGAGDDVMRGGKDADTISGNDGDDWIAGDTGHDVLAGDDGDDTLYGKDGYDTITGGDGADWISGGKGEDNLSGGAGADEIYGNTGHDVIEAGSGDDTVYANDGFDQVDGNSGNDWISGGKGEDVLSGNSGNDTLYGNSGFDTLSGDTGDDLLFGGKGNDRLDGGDDDDTIEGGSGTDIITGGDGNDILRGGSGSDDFVFDAGFGMDTIQDFAVAADDLIFSLEVFATKSDALDAVVSLGDENCAIVVSAVDQIVLLGVSADELDGGDFGLV